MIAGRFQWYAAGVPAKLGLMAFDFPVGTLVLTEASKSTVPPCISFRVKRVLPSLIWVGLSLQNQTLNNLRKYYRTESYSETSYDRPTYSRRHRQCLLR